MGSIKKIFATLPSPAQTMIDGLYEAHFVGPWFMRVSARPTMNIFSLPNWFGKRFLSPSTACNVIIQNGQQQQVIPMQGTYTQSCIDQKDCYTLTYDATAPIPWRYVRDDLKQLSPTVLLGLTTVQLPILSWFKFPFLLVKVEQ